MHPECLKNIWNEINPSLIEREKEAWEIHVKEK
jgi:hypothetical protein